MEAASEETVGKALLRGNMEKQGNEPNKTKSNGLEEKTILTRKQREAIPHLVGARSLEEGCKKARIAKFTLYHWLSDDPFKD